MPAKDTYEMRSCAGVPACVWSSTAEAEITALSRGATLVLVPEDAKPSPPALSAFIRDGAAIIGATGAAWPGRRWPTRTCAVCLWR
jgi:hypothetical protein